MGSKQFSRLFLRGLIVSLLIATSCLSSMPSIAANPQTEIGSRGTSPATGTTPPKTDSTEVSEAFDKCVTDFFSTTLPADIDKLGLTYTPAYTYAWFVEVVQRVVPEQDGDLRLKSARPLFTDDGWAQFTVFYDEQIKPFFATTRNSLIIGRLMSAPRLLNGESVMDSNGVRIGSKAVFDVEYSFRFIQQAARIEDAKSTEKFSRFIVSVTHLKGDQTLKIDSWRVRETVIK